MAFMCPNCNATLPDKSWLDVLFEDEDGGSPKADITSFSEDWHLSKAGEYPIHRIFRGRWVRCLECHHTFCVSARFARGRKVVYRQANGRS